MQFVAMPILGINNSPVNFNCLHVYVNLVQWPYWKSKLNSLSFKNGPFSKVRWRANKSSQWYSYIFTKYNLINIWKKIGRVQNSSKLPVSLALVQVTTFVIAALFVDKFVELLTEFFKRKNYLTNFNRIFTDFIYLKVKIYSY